MVQACVRSQSVVSSVTPELLTTLALHAVQPTAAGLPAAQLGLIVTTRLCNVTPGTFRCPAELKTRTSPCHAPSIRPGLARVNPPVSELF